MIRCLLFLWFVFLLFFSLLPLTISLLSKYMGPPLSLANARAGYPSFFMRATAPSSAHEREARAGSFFLSFSFHSLTAAPSCPPPSVTCRAVVSRRAFITRHVVPVVSRRAFVTHRPCRIASRPHHVSPLSRRVAPSSRVASVALHCALVTRRVVPSSRIASVASRRALVTRRPCHVASSDLRWRRV